MQEIDLSTFAAANRTLFMLIRSAFFIILSQRLLRVETNWILLACALRQDLMTEGVYSQWLSTNEHKLCKFSDSSLPVA